MKTLTKSRRKSSKIASENLKEGCTSMLAFGEVIYIDLH